MKVCLFVVCLLAPALRVAAQDPTSRLSPAQRKIEAAQAAITKDPGRYQGYNDLALALARRARETSDTPYYQQAEAALKKSFQLAAANFEGQKAQILILLGEHEYSRARDEARALSRQMPDDVLLHGYLADAASALGDYEEAEKEAQWMLDLRPGNVPGLVRGAYLRKIWGETEGSRDFLNQAFQETPPFEVEDVAWLLTQMADLDLITGKVDLADKLLTQALVTFPGYYLALEGLARVRTIQHKYAEAVDLLRQRNQEAPNPQSVYALAKALEGAGQKDKAKATYAEFEAQARALIDKANNANRELIMYYADHALNPAEALRIARLEVGRRHDVYTVDAYAWALYADGQRAEAHTQMEKALAVGVRDPELLQHAEKIDARLTQKQ